VCVLLAVSEQYVARPHIQEVCPSEGPSTGGTVVTVRGRDLGLGRDDVVGLYICGSNVVESVQYISSERLVCITAAWRPCVGYVTVETVSGGRASSSAQFTFTVGSEPVQHTQAMARGNERRRFSLSILNDTRSSAR